MYHVCKLCDPAFPDIEQAQIKQADAAGDKQEEVNPEGQHMDAVYGSVEDVGPVGQGQDIGQGLEQDGQFSNGKEEPAEKHHRKSEEVGKGLRLEDFGHRYRNKKTEKGRYHRNQHHRRNKDRPDKPG